jgi:hypothetical protein
MSRQQPCFDVCRRANCRRAPSGLRLHLAAQLGWLRVLRVFVQYLVGATKEAAKGSVDVRDRRRRLLRSTSPLGQAMQLP